MARNYKELRVWQSAMALARAVYRLTDRFPDHEKFGLVSQLRRAAVSIPSNIAEGQGRASVGEFLQFPGHARGSLHEVETQILLAQDFAFAAEPDYVEPFQRIEEVGCLLSGLIRSLKDRRSDTVD